MDGEVGSLPRPTSNGAIGRGLRTTRSPVRGFAASDAAEHLFSRYHVPKTATLAVRLRPSRARRRLVPNMLGHLAPMTSLPVSMFTGTAAREPPPVAVQARAAFRRVRIHRGVLQPPPAPLHPRDALPTRLRTTTTLADRAVEDNHSNNNNQQTNPVSRKPGRSIHQTAASGHLLQRRPHRSTLPTLLVWNKQPPQPRPHDCRFPGRGGRLDPRDPIAHTVGELRVESQAV